MAKLNHRWQVQPHGPVETLDTGLVTVAGEIRMPLGRFPRRMTAVALRGGRSLIWSPIPLGEPEMATLMELGEPAFLVVPGIAHRLDLIPWKTRFPQARVVCAPGARNAVQEAVPVDDTTGDFEDLDVSFEVVPGIAGKEAALRVSRPGGLSLILNDILANVRHPEGVGAQIMARLFGFGVDRPRVPWLAKRAFVEDRAALAAAFRRWSREPMLVRIIVSHGDVIADRPRETLGAVADELNR